MQPTLRRSRQRLADGDRGFTLIELLVVVVIIGVLVAIAIPIYLNYKHGAENRSAQADVRNAVTAVEQCSSEMGGGNFPASVTATYGSPAGTTSATLTCTGGTDQKMNISPGNTIVYTKVGAGPYTYTIKVTNSDTGKSYTYDSNTGQIS